MQSSVKTSTPEPVGSTPSMGGTLNATTEQAAKDKERELQNNQNKTILTHGEYIGSNEPSFGDMPLNAAMGKSDEPPKIDPFVNNSSTAALPGMGAPETSPAAPTDESIMDAIAKDTTQLTGKPAAPASPAVNDRESALAAVDAVILLTDGNTLTEGAKKYIKSGVEVKIIGGNKVISQRDRKSVV